MFLDVYTGASPGEEPAEEEEEEAESSQKVEAWQTAGYKLIARGQVAVVLIAGEDRLRVRLPAKAASVSVAHISECFA